MQRDGMPLLVHGEVTDPEVDVFDREAVFIERAPASRCGATFPALKIVLEHITTQRGAQFVAEAGANIAATITAHHLLFNRNAIFSRRPSAAPLLPAGAEARAASARAGRGGDLGQRPLLPRHRQRAARRRAPKETPAAAPASTPRFSALELYAEAFEAAGALDRLEDFASRSRRRRSTACRATPAPSRSKAALDAARIAAVRRGRAQPLRGGETLAWRLAPDPC